jgi:hypothetical protein
MFFTVRQKLHKYSDATMKTRDRSLLQMKNDLKAFLALGTKDLWISFEPFGKLI